MERKPPPNGNTSVANSENVIQGNDNELHDYSQTINNYYPPPVDTYDEIQVSPEEVLAFYDRENIYPIVEHRLRQRPFSSFIVLGDFDDWHDGLFRRLKNLHAQAISIDLAWPTGYADDGESMLWSAVIKELGGLPIATAQSGTLKAAIVDRLRSLTGEHREIIVATKIDADSVNHDTCALLKAFIGDWQHIVQQLQGLNLQRSDDPTHIAVVFNVVNHSSKHPGKFFINFLNYLFGKDKRRRHKQLQKLFNDCTCEALCLVHKRHLPDWRKSMEKYYPTPSSQAHWLDRVQNAITEQFQPAHREFPLGKVKESLSSDRHLDKFKYKIPRGS